MVRRMISREVHHEIHKVKWWRENRFPHKFPLVQIQKEIISDLKRENQFLSKEIKESIKLISRQRYVNRIQN
jgi:hypothetical protein